MAQRNTLTICPTYSVAGTYREKEKHYFAHPLTGKGLKRTLLRFTPGVQSPGIEKTKILLLYSHIGISSKQHTYGSFPEFVLQNMPKSTRLITLSKPVFRMVVPS